MKPVSRDNGGKVVPELSLVCATKGRSTELEVFLASLVPQTYRDFEIIVVDQNEPGFLDRIIGAYSSQLPLRHIRIKEFGGCLARNRGIRESCGRIISFPDDDCEYPADLLEQVMRRFATDDELDLFSGSCRSKTGGGFEMAKFAEGEAVLTLQNFWNRHIFFTLFVKREYCFAVDLLDERLGVGRRFGSSEETDFTLRLLAAGAQGLYDASIFVYHPPERKNSSDRSLRRAWSYGLGWGGFVQKHLTGPHWRLVLPRYLQSLFRSLGGCLVMLVRLRFGQARYYAYSFAGRCCGLLLPLR